MTTKGARGISVPRPIWLLILIALILAVVVATALNLKVFNFGGPAAPPSRAANVLTPGSVQAFSYLSQQTSNSCNLQAATVQTYPDGTRIQGACCNPLDQTTYQNQVKELNAYKDIPEIPKDPYDIPASLAKQLLGYDSSIKLDAAQQATFDKAMSMTPDKAPCCCKCWRWYAHSGLAKHLITARGFKAEEVGRVVAAVNGCGGKRDTAMRTDHAPPGSTGPLQALVG